MTPVAAGAMCDRTRMRLDWAPMSPTAQPLPPMGRRAFLAAGAATLLAVAAGCSGPAGSDEVDRAGDNLGFGGTVLAEPLAKPTATFTDTSGQPYDFATATEGRMALLFFGYTSCPDICPRHLGIVADAFENVRLQGGVPEVAFVGVDTARDTPEVLRSYLDKFDRRFVGLTATPEVIDAALTELKLPGVVIDPEGKGGNYPVGHPSQILAYTPDGLCHVVYPFGTRQQTWEQDLPRLETHDWSTA